MPLKNMKQRLDRLSLQNVTHTQTGKRVVKVSIILSYWLIPSGVLLGTSPDKFVAALHKTWEFLNKGVNKLFLTLYYKCTDGYMHQQACRERKMPSYDHILQED